MRVIVNLYTVHVKGSEDTYFKRVNEKLLTIKEYTCTRFH